MAFTLKLAELQPSQLYINEAKLAAIHEEMNFVLPVKRLGDIIYLTDGHTRAFYLWQKGETFIEVEWERDELDDNLYKTCLQWCQAERIRSIADLAGRTISAAQYEELWIRRCERTQHFS